MESVQYIQYLTMGEISLGKEFSLVLIWNYTHGKGRKVNLSINHHQYTIYKRGTNKESISLFINYLNGSHKHRKSTKENIYRTHDLMNKKNED